MNGKPERPFQPSRGPRHTGDCLETSRVIDTRYRGSGIVYRWRECTRCKARFATHEISFEELERLRSIARVQQEIVELAESIYSRFGPKPDVKSGAAFAGTAGDPPANRSPLTMRAAA